VPDRFGQLARQFDLGDLGAALATEAALGPLVALGVEIGPRRSVLPDDPRAKAGVAAELGRRGEAFDVADLRGDGERVDPAEAGRGDQQRDVAVIGAAPFELDGQLGDLQLEDGDVNRGCEPAIVRRLLTRARSAELAARTRGARLLPAGRPDRRPPWVKHPTGMRR